MFSRPGTEGPNPRLILAFLALVVAAQGFYAALSVFVDTPMEDHLFGMAIDAILLYYLNKQSIKDLFAA
ncbi:MAG: hypothetical protein ACSLFN_12015 [Candidatus Limnocylindrales bacterium]